MLGRRDCRRASGCYDCVNRSGPGRCRPDHESSNTDSTASSRCFVTTACAGIIIVDGARTRRGESRAGYCLASACIGAIGWGGFSGCGSRPCGERSCGGQSETEPRG